MVETALRRALSRSARIASRAFGRATYDKRTPSQLGPQVTTRFLSSVPMTIFRGLPSGFRNKLGIETGLFARRLAQEPLGPTMAGSLLS